MSSEEIPAAGTPAESTPDTGPARADLNLTDPKAMRALAHPVRMALLELIQVAGTLTATQASEVLGESPANCAFHLRTLGKYGYVTEAGGGKGRERPWKRVNQRINLSTYQDDPSVSLTARTLQQVWLDRVLQRARKALSSSDELPQGWRDAEEAAQTVVFLSAEETRQLSQDVLRLLDRYKERHDTPSERPAGVLPVEALFFAYPLADLAAIAAMTDSAPENVRPHRHNERPVTKEP